MFTQDSQNLVNRGANQEPTPKTVLFVSDLPENISENELQIFFNEFKDGIALIQINNNARPNETKATSNATVIFKDAKKADDARNGLNLRKLKGKTIRIMWHERDTSQRYSNDSNLFIKNIPLNTKPREFYELFLQFGEIVSAKLMEDENGNHFGYGYIHYVENDSAQKALEHCEKNIIFGETLDIKYFQKKTDRFNPMSGNKNVYVKNIPINTKESEVKDLFNTYGNITWMKLHEENERMFATISFENEDSSSKAINELNGKNFKGSELFVNNLMKKADREKIIMKNTDNVRFGGYGRNCNLHIRNIPFEVTDEYLTEIFSKFGEVVSTKIQKYTLLGSKESKEQTLSKGFGYICFKTEEAASKAKDEFNGKRLPKYETWNRPLLIEVFMPKGERLRMNKAINSQFNPYAQNKKIPFMGGQIPFNNNFNNLNNYMFPMMYQPMNSMMYPPNQNNFNPNLNPYYKNNKMPMQVNFSNPNINNNLINPVIHKQMQPSIPKVNQQQTNNNNTTSTSSTDHQPDFKYMESLEDDMAKKDYLGEFIFRKIENHEFTKRKVLTIDTIGKITGMILGIDEVNEIIEISRSNEQLTQRIQEALELLLENAK